MTQAEIAEDIDGFREYAMIVEPRESLMVVDADPNDDKFFECAVAGGVAYLFSRDERLLAITESRVIRVLSPAELLAIVKEGSSA